MSAKNLLTQMAEAYLADGFDSASLRAGRDAGELLSDAVADRMEEIEAGR